MMAKEKIKDSQELADIIRGIKARKKVVVFTNGCFDILHPGHIAYLAEAKSLGDTLVVGINSDGSVRRLKGAGRPVIKEGDRAAMLASLETVDFVTVFEEDDPAALIKTLDPNVLVKGGDWKKNEIIGGDFVRKRGGKVAAIPFLEGYSTTGLIEKIRSCA